jgi:hypothetical protein
MLGRDSRINRMWRGRVCVDWQQFLETEKEDFSLSDSTIAEYSKILIISWLLELFYSSSQALKLTYGGLRSIHL